ncbi:MAG: alpha-amylase family glycosyl hydrolase [Corynebacterium sp.]|nr:alpha-amylase family glycosyl hydrolase [Corynebacterium sp.]
MKEFSVWAPNATTVELVVDGQTHPMTQTGELWRSDLTPTPGMRYGYQLDGTLLPDPRSQRQPDGVHGLSEVTDPTFDWHNDWTGQQRSLIYELHVKSFAGDFQGVIEKLPYLRSLQVGAIELMPVQPFAGDRNWGYDGVYWHAVHECYGGPYGLKQLVDAAHGHGIAVYLDVVYNHFGPEGNYTNHFGPYTVPSPTGWGDGINMTNPHVRNYILDAVRLWFAEYRIDGLRLDATHAYTDITLLDDIAAIAKEITSSTGIRRIVIAEDLRDNPEITTKHGIDLQWNDSIHHALHSIVSGEQHAYYEGYNSVPMLVSAINRRGASVVYTTTHDQVGNRPQGDRPSQNLTDKQQVLKAAVITAIGSPTMLFMGEEYGATTPFPFFCSHSDPGVIHSTQLGRKRQFKQMGLHQPPLDPADPQTYEMSRLDWNINPEVFAAYQTLLSMSRSLKPTKAVGGEHWLAILGMDPFVANLSDTTITLPYGGQLRYSFGNPHITETEITLDPWEFAFCTWLDIPATFEGDIAQ